MITYTTPWPEHPTIRTPKLHKVVYHRCKNFETWASADLVKSVNHWLEQHCKNPYYRSPGWHLDLFIEFEDDKEAMLFALRWGV